MKKDGLQITQTSNGENFTLVSVLQVNPYILWIPPPRISKKKPCRNPLTSQIKNLCQQVPTARTEAHVMNSHSEHTLVRYVI